MIKIGIVSKYETVMSSLTFENLNLFALTKPKCSLVATRADKMEPIAPLMLNSGGNSTNNIGYLLNEEIFVWIARPAKIETEPPTINIGNDSLTMRFTVSI